MDKMKETNLKDLLKPYAKYGLWVALDDNQTKVFATGKTIDEVIINTRKITSEKPTLIKAVENYSTFIPIIKYENPIFVS
jgi:hypothetical protein